jgi:hypothetical protein
VSVVQLYHKMTLRIEEALLHLESRAKLHLKQHPVANLVSLSLSLSLSLSSLPVSLSLSPVSVSVSVQVLCVCVVRGGWGGGMGQRKPESVTFFFCGQTIACPRCIAATPPVAPIHPQ